MTMAAEGNRPLLPPTDAALDTDEAVHAALEGVCGCGACTAQKLGAALPPPENQQSAASQGSTAAPTPAEIIAALQFELSHLSDDTLNTSAQPAYQFTYQFENRAPSDLPTDQTFSSWTALSGAEKSAVRAAMAHMETVLNVSFVEVSGRADPDLNIGKVNLAPGIAGYGGFRYTSTSYDGGNSWQLWDYDGFAVFDIAVDLTTAPGLILHELGHALTLKHPFQGTPRIDPDFDSHKWTVMSYDVNPDLRVKADALQLYDILALQDRWGSAENNTYSTRYTGPTTQTTEVIWDTHGRSDFLDAKGYAAGVSLNLNPGNYSRFTARDDVIIAFGTSIEHARGSNHDDTLTGNELANKLIGGCGDDVLIGGAGHDKFYGQRGDDILYGGTFMDALYGGTGADQLYGGDNKDILDGSYGRDLLDGGAANDILTGGPGRDSFYFREGSRYDIITDFENDLDRLFFDMDGITTRFEVRSYGKQRDNDVVFSFGDNDYLRIMNVTLEEISDDLHIA